MLEGKPKKELPDIPTKTERERGFPSGIGRTNRKLGDLRVGELRKRGGLGLKAEKRHYCGGGCEGFGKSRPIRYHPRLKGMRKLEISLKGRPIRRLY